MMMMIMVTKIMQNCKGVVSSTERLDRLPTPVPVANPRIRPSRLTFPHIYCQ